LEPNYDSISNDENLTVNYNWEQPLQTQPSLKAQNQQNSAPDGSGLHMNQQAEYRGPAVDGDVDFSLRALDARQPPSRPQR